MSGVIVHEWLESVGGGERVADALAAEFPDASIVCPWDDVDGRYSGRVKQSWLAGTPLRRHKAVATPFLLPWWRSLPASDADWVLVATHLFAHHARPRGAARDAPKYVYTYSPARSIWEPDIDERGKGLVARAASGPLRALDRRRATEPAKIAAVSRFIAERIERCWHRESTVINPPVDVAAYPGSDDELTDEELRQIEALPDGFVFGASRFVPYKRVDVAIRAGAAADLPVVIAGDGPERARLRALADEHPGRVTFVHRPSDAVMRALYRRASVYVFAAVEDFGIMPVEAMAAGTPVVGNAVGGASETVVDGETGALFRSTDAAELLRGVEVASAVDPSACRARASQFDGARFGARIREWIEA